MLGSRYSDADPIGGAAGSALSTSIYRTAPQCPVRKGGGVAALGSKARLALPSTPPAHPRVTL